MTKKTAQASNPPNALLGQLQATLDRRERASARRRLSIAAKDTVDFSSNDFLSLSKSSVLRSAFLAELQQTSHLPLSSGGSRLLDGNSLYTEELEKEIAAFHRAPAGLLFNSGFDANHGMFACLPGRADIIVYDEYVHASVHEGMRLSRAAAVVSFKHNSLQDFERVLQGVSARNGGFKTGKHNVFIAVESVYSMDGDVAPIVALLDIKDRILPEDNGHMIVDEAHSTGVFGSKGRGLICELGVEHRLLARLHTFGKALASNGSVVLCHPIVREYLINYARSLIYTTAMGLPALAMIKSVYGMLQTGLTVESQRHLWRLVHYFHHRLKSIVSTSSFTYQEEAPKSPIFSLITENPRNLAANCQARGFIVRPIVPPTVPEGSQRVRVCLHTDNTTEEIDQLVDCLAAWRDYEESRL